MTDGAERCVGATTRCNTRLYNVSVVLDIHSICYTFL